jgi:hypothetical protein
MEVVNRHLRYSLNSGRPDDPGAKNLLTGFARKWVRPLMGGARFTGANGGMHYARQQLRDETSLIYSRLVRASFLLDKTVPSRRVTRSECHDRVLSIGFRCIVRGAGTLRCWHEELLRG